MILTQKAKDWIIKQFRNYLESNDVCIEDYENMLRDNGKLIEELAGIVECYFYEIDAEIPSDEKCVELAKEMLNNKDIFPTYEILEVFENKYPNIYGAIQELFY